MSTSLSPKLTAALRRVQRPLGDEVQDRELAEFAEWASHASKYGEWNPYWYLKRLSDVIEYRLRRSIADGSNHYIKTHLPIRHGKSELTSHWLPAWYLNYFPHRRVILTTYADDFATSWGRKIRWELRENPRVNNALLSPDREAASEFELVQGGSLLCAGVDGQITGRGAHLIVIDDPYKNWEQAHSKAYNEKLIDWFESTLWTRREPGCTIIVNMTRWSKRVWGEGTENEIVSDFAEYLEVAHGIDWETFRFPAWKDKIDDNPLDDRDKGEPLCPQRYDDDGLKEIETGMTVRKAQAILQQRPRKHDDEDAVFKRKHINGHRRPNHPTLKRIVIAVDPPAGSDDRTSECGIVADALGEDGEFYTLEDASLHGSAAQWGKAAVRLYDRYNADRSVGEVNNGGDMVEHVIRKEAEELHRLGERDTKFVSYKSIRASRGKAIRAEPIAALYENGRVHHVGKFGELEDQMTSWNPTEKESPDRMDAQVWALTDLSSSAGGRKLTYGN